MLPKKFAPGAEFLKRDAEKHSALLRQLQLEALAALAKNANAKIYIGFDKHIVADVTERAN